MCVIKTIASIRGIDRVYVWKHANRSDGLHHVQIGAVIVVAQPRGRPRSDGLHHVQIGGVIAVAQPRGRPLTLETQQ